MFLIFSLRRPNILPYTDLGVQKGLLRFALTAHNAFPENKTKGKFQLSKKKKDHAVKDKVNNEGQGELETTLETTRPSTPPPQVTSDGAPPTPFTPSNEGQQTKRAALHTPNGPVPMVAPPTPISPGPQQVLEVQDNELPELAPEDLLEPTTGSDWDPHRVAPLHAGLTLDTMRSRWGGKKAKYVEYPLPQVKTGESGNAHTLLSRGGAYLTPDEMEALTAGWQPYRSLGVYYTWAIADGGEA